MPSLIASPSPPFPIPPPATVPPPAGDHNYIRCSPKFFSVAVRGGGGPVLVLPYSSFGKLPTGAPTINGHSAAVYDTAWNPFNDNMLATSSDDTTVKVWSIPDGGLTENMRDPLVTLNGHGKPVSLLQWHPTANNVIASAGKEPSVKIWDVEKAAAKISLEGFGGLVQDMAWSHDGAQLMTSTKDKLAKVHDPRGGSIVHEWTPHEGGKAFKALFLGESGRVLTVGFTKQSKREFKIWDVKATTAKPISTFELDQASGVMIPFYDEDTRMLYLTGKVRRRAAAATAALTTGPVSCVRRVARPPRRVCIHGPPPPGPPPPPPPPPW